MTKGRNTSVISVRVPDEVVSRLKKMAKNRRQTMTELLKPVIGNFAIRGHIPRVVYEIEKVDDVIEEPPHEQKENPHNWDSPEPKFQASPSNETRNKAKAKRKAKKKKRR